MQVIRVDRSASQKKTELEPAAAGTSDDSSRLKEFLHDYFTKKAHSQQVADMNDSKMNDSKKLLSFLNDWFRSKARTAPAARAHGTYY